MTAIGDRKLFLFEKTFGYLVRLPAPYTEATILEHLRHIGDRVDGLQIVTLEVVEIRSAREVLKEANGVTRESRDKADTIPAPAPDIEPEAREMGNG